MKVSPQLVFIVWEDSVRPNPSWGWVSEFKPQPVVRIRSVGWLVHDGDDMKVIAPNLSKADEDGDRQLCGSISIPTRAIVKMETLGVPPDEVECDMDPERIEGILDEICREKTPSLFRGDNP